MMMESETKGNFNRENYILYSCSVLAGRLNIKMLPGKASHLISWMLNLGGQCYAYTLHHANVALRQVNDMWRKWIGGYVH